MKRRLSDQHQTGRTILSWGSQSARSPCRSFGSFLSRFSFTNTRKTNKLSNQHENIQLDFSPIVCIWFVLLPYGPVLEGSSVFLLKIPPGPLGLKCPIMTACEPGITYKYILLPCGLIASHVEVVFVCYCTYLSTYSLKHPVNISRLQKKQVYIHANK